MQTKLSGNTSKTAKKKNHKTEISMNSANYVTWGIVFKKT